MTAIPKPCLADRKAAKARIQRGQRQTRAVVKRIVWLRATGRCERCGCEVRTDVYAWADNRAQFHEEPPRSLGGDPYDPNQVLLLCAACHRSGPIRSHITRQQMRTR